MKRSLRMLLLSAVLLPAAPSLAVSFTVLGWDAGQTVGVSFNGDSRSVATALFHESVDGVLGTSFCTDLLQTISTGTYSDFVAYDPAVADGMPSLDVPAPPRQFVFAAQISSAWSNEIDVLAASLGVTKVQAITGVQVAIWEAVYGDAFAWTSMSAGAQKVFGYVSGLTYGGYGQTLLYVSGTRQDQLFTPPVPEPSAMLVFGVGGALVGRALVRRRARA
jgi:hypothetical protein